ncbi:hypothetical protein GCM10009664_12730 [Kitasatospora gansuensis]
MVASGAVLALLLTAAGCSSSSDDDCDNWSAGSVAAPGSAVQAQLLAKSSKGSKSSKKAKSHKGSKHKSSGGDDCDD